MRTLLAIFLLSSAHNVIACELVIDQGLNDHIALTPIDQHKLSEAVLAYVNFERCKAGVGVLSANKTLIAVAADHSHDMVRLGFFDHESPVLGRHTMAQRLGSEDVRYKQAAENIAQQNVYAFERRKFIVRDLAKCQFIYADNQRLVPQHSYMSVARSVVKSWMSSPGHRKNILNRAFKKIGTAMAVDSGAPFCGDLLLTQNFTD